MEPLRFISVKLTIGLVLGILLSYYLEIHPYIPLIATTLIIVFLGFALKQQRIKKSMPFGIMATMGTIGIGILSCSLSKPKNHYDHYTLQELTAPHPWLLKIHETLKPNSYSDRYLAKVMACDNSKVSGEILLNSRINPLGNTLQVDDELMVYGTLAPIKAPSNPYQFNYKEYMRNLGVENQLYLNSWNYVLKKSHSVTLYGIAGKLRNQIISKLQNRNFGKEELGIIQALLLGQRNDISPETYNNYVNAGAVHILAVSGLHIGILLLLLQFLLQPMELLPKGRQLKLLAIVLLLWCFALLAGLSASIIRAVTMFSFVAYAQYLNRPTSTFNILALSMFFILLVNPMLLFQVGFQMSYATVFAIVWIYPLLQKLWIPKYGILKYVWRLLSVSIAAQLGVLPISLFYFHQFPALFFVSNLAVIPFLGLILGLGILVMALALGQVLPEFLVIFYNDVIGMMNTLMGWVAQQELFIFKNISFDGLQLLLSYVVTISGGALMSKVSYKRTIVCLTAIIGFQIWTLYSHYATQQKEVFFIAHQTKNSVLMHQFAGQLHLYSSDTIQAEKLEVDYTIGANIRKVLYQPLQNSYFVGDKRLYIMDSLAIYPEAEKVHYLLLSQSPAINLERLLHTYRPEMIIVDGSNYKSDVEKWGATCLKNKIPFHYTGEKGAYYFEMQ